MKHSLSLLALIAASSATFVALPAEADARAAGDLSAIIAFENPSDPWLSEKSDSIFSPVWAESKASLSIPGKGLVPVSAGDAPAGWSSNSVSLEGRWNGLAMTRFDLNGVPNSGIGSYVLHFNEAPATVVARLDRLGFPVRKVGSEVSTGDSDCGAKMRVEGQALTSTFTISFAC